MTRKVWINNSKKIKDHCMGERDSKFQGFDNFVLAIAKMWVKYEEQEFTL